MRVACMLGAGYAAPLTGVVFVAEYARRLTVFVPALVAVATTQLVVGPGRSARTSWSERIGTMEVFLAGLVVAAISFVSGGFAIPIGFSLGLEPLEVYIAASVGSMAGLVVFLYAGDKVRNRLMEGREPKEPDADSRIRQLSEKYGAKGLGLVGPIFPGVTASVVIGLSLGIRRASLARWLSIGVAVMFALYTFGLWLLVELFGVE